MLASVSGVKCGTKKKKCVSADLQIRTHQYCAEHVSSLQCQMIFSFPFCVVIRSVYIYSTACDLSFEYLYPSKCYIGITWMEVLAVRL